MYDQMSQGKPVDGTRSGVFPGASTVRPAMTWTNNAVPPQRRRSVPVSPITRLQSLSLADKPEGMILSGTADAEHSSPQSPTRIKDWYYELLKGATEAQNLIDICENQKWNWVATPLLTTAVPGGIISAGGKLTNLGPSKKIVEDAEIVTGATAVTKMANNTSIVEDMSGQTYNEWHCLWTGDAGSKRGYGEKGLALQNALGIAELSGSSAKSAKSAPQKHYLLMKVPHHGSEASNSPGFFAAVTADRESRETLSLPSWSSTANHEHRLPDCRQLQGPGCTSTRRMYSVDSRWACRNACGCCGQQYQARSAQDMDQQPPPARLYVQLPGWRDLLSQQCHSW